MHVSIVAGTVAGYPCVLVHVSAVIGHYLTKNVGRLGREHWSLSACGKGSECLCSLTGYHSLVCSASVQFHVDPYLVICAPQPGKTYNSFIHMQHQWQFVYRSYRDSPYICNLSPIQYTVFPPNMSSLLIIMIPPLFRAAKCSTSQKSYMLEIVSSCYFLHLQQLHGLLWANNILNVG